MNDLECVRAALGETDRIAFAAVPEPFLAKLNSGEQFMAANKAMLDAVAKKLSQAIRKYPMRLEKTALSIVAFVEAAKAKGPDYLAGQGIADDFAAKFNLNAEDSKSQKAQIENMENDEKEDSPMDAVSKLSPELQRILPQMLFRSFFSMIGERQRGRLVAFMEEHGLCDDALVEELKGRIGDEKVKDEFKIEALLKKVEEGGMDGFRWLHGMLFEFFNGIMEAEDRRQETVRQLKEECKRHAETPLDVAGDAKPEPVVKAPVEASNDVKPEPLRGNLEIENAKLRNELAAKEELFTLKMEAEKAKLIAEYGIPASSLKAERQSLENEMGKLAENCDRKLKLSAHAFETFLDTLPRRYSAPGYVMLRSIVNEWDGDLQSVQTKERKYAQKPEGETPPKGFWKTLKSHWWSIAILLLLFAAICADAIMRMKQAKAAAEARAATRSESVAESPRSSERRSTTGNDETLSLIDSFQSLQSRKTSEASR